MIPIRNDSDRKEASCHKENSASEARSLFCYWVGHELGFSLTELARHLGISVAGVGYSVKRGEIIARENHFQLIE